MSKTLIVSYTPREGSNTEKLVQTFIQQAAEKSRITHVRLERDPAPLLLEENLNALLKRNFSGLQLTETEGSAVRSSDQLLEQLQSADRIVLAFPMYNFSVPASVKAWVDAVIQNGKTFEITDQGNYQGLCQGKKALVLMTTGSDFSQEPIKSMDFATPLIKNCMQFMGIESQQIAAYGLNQYMHKADQIIGDTQREIVDFLAQSKFLSTS